MLKRVVKFLLYKIGYNISRIGKMEIREDEMTKALRRVSIHSKINIVVDIGAAAGSWTEKAIQVWPDSIYFLFEPLHERSGDLKDLQVRYGKKRIQIYPKAVGNIDGKLEITVTNDLDGTGFYGNGNLREIDVVKLDSIFKEHDNFILLKLDTHGFEIPIFEGAINTLQNVECIVVETYGFYVAPNSKLFHEISKYLFDCGFRLYDIVDIMRRPKDEAFWQCDAIFLKKDHNIFNDNSYQ